MCHIHSERYSIDGGMRTKKRNRMCMLKQFGSTFSSWSLHGQWFIRTYPLRPHQCMESGLYHWDHSTYFLEVQTFQSMLGSDLDLLEASSLQTFYVERFNAWNCDAVATTHFQDVLHCIRTIFLYSIWTMDSNATFIGSQFSLEAFHKMFYADFKSEITAKGVLLRKDDKYWDSKARSILRTFSLSYLFLVIISIIYLKKKDDPALI